MSEISQDEDFLKAAILDTFVPNSSSIDVQKALSPAFEPKNHGNFFALQEIEQRSLVFFGTIGSPLRRRIVLLIPRSTDEKIAIYIVLRVPNISQGALSHRLSRLDVGLDVYASNDNGPQSPRDGTEANRDLLFSGSVLKQEPVILGGQEDATQLASVLLAVWKAEAVLRQSLLRRNNLPGQLTVSIRSTTSAFPKSSHLFRGLRQSFSYENSVRSNLGK